MSRKRDTQTEVSRRPTPGITVGPGRREVRPFGLPDPLSGRTWLVVVRRATYLACAIAVASGAFALQASPGVSARVGSHVSLTSFESSVLLQLNEVRAEHGLAPLRLNVALTAAANQHCTEMVADGYFDHPSADGLPITGRIRHYYRAARFRYWSVGENLLWTIGNPGAVRVVDMWMSSPEHRANLLSPAWRDIGISVVSAADAPGVFANHNVTVIATDFGVRR
jgi:uncharacterized protein YkwD